MYMSLIEAKWYGLTDGPAITQTQSTEIPSQMPSRVAPPSIETLESSSTSGKLHSRLPSGCGNLDTSHKYV